MLTPLSDSLMKPFVEAALREDMGRAGDITTEAIIDARARSRVILRARKSGVLAGRDLARLAFQTLDPSASFLAAKNDGDEVKDGDILAEIRGLSRALLTAERTALNFMCHLSGIATETRKMVEAVKPHKARICDTRKTNPGLRLLEKYAVRAGGGSNHRFGLDDAVLIKDNHIAMALGVGPALERAREAVGHSVKVEIEVDTLAQLDEVIALLPTTPADAVLLDNMPIPMLKQAVEKVAGRMVTEASGGVTLQKVAAIAATGVDVISIGALTHSAPILDIGLDID